MKHTAACETAAASVGFRKPGQCECTVLSMPLTHARQTSPPRHGAPHDCRASDRCLVASDRRGMAGSIRAVP